jgi:hypothetical protein
MRRCLLRWLSISLQILAHILAKWQAICRNRFRSFQLPHTGHV